MKTVRQELPTDAEREEARIWAAYRRRRDGSRYSWMNTAHVFMAQERERKVLAILRRYRCMPLPGRKILEAGCGTGHWLREFVKWGADPGNVTGVDLLEHRVAEAQRLCPPGVQVRRGNATRLEFEDATFDLVLQATLFTSVLEGAMRAQIAAELLRVVKRDGFILWYDYRVNNPANPDVRAVTRREIRRLFPNCHVDLQLTTLAPPLTRCIARQSWLLCYLLGKIPWLCTHYLGVIRRADG
jgi:ubiquinone/menaquinone biosynthesis C-methylase UbiE